GRLSGHLRPPRHGRFIVSDRSGFRYVLYGISERAYDRFMNFPLAPMPPPAEISGDTPTMRLFSLLESIAAKDRLVTLHGLAEETGMPKPTLHRMLQQLETAGLLRRDGDGRQYGI